MNIGKKEKLIVIILLLIFAALSFTSSLYKAPVFDEGIHIAGGYNAWMNRDFRINPENGLLPGMLGAFPLIFDEDIKFPKDSRWWSICDHWKITQEFFYQRGNNFNQMFFQARIMMIIAAVFGGIVVYLASRRLWGSSGGIISLILYVLSPSMLAHSRFVTSDMLAAIFFFISAWLFWILLNRFTVVRLFLLALALAFLALSKMSAILILPVLLLIGAMRIIIGCGWKGNIFSYQFMANKRLSQSGIIILILLFSGLFSFCVIWGAFNFRYSMLADEQGRNVLEKGAWPSLLKTDNLPIKLISYAKEQKLLPEAYLLGMAFVMKSSKNRIAFLNGKYSLVGWKSFFPLAFIYKTPIAIILLFLFGLGVPLSVAIRTKSKSKKVLMLWYISFSLALILVYFSVAMISSLNIGHRHILPIYMPLFVLAGGIAVWIKRYKLPAKIVVGLVLIFLLGENLFIYPNYLAYFSPVAGGASNGYKHLVDSSLDWGQDLQGLKGWLKSNKLNDEEVYIAYFGSVDLDAYGMPQKRLPCYFSQKRNSLFQLQGGTYCISTTMLQMIYYPRYASWDQGKEIEYQNYQRQFEKLIAARRNPESLKSLLKNNGEKYWMNVYEKYEQLRFSKLMTALRKRQPDHMIGYTYLIYELSDEDLRQILAK